jgi:hypothetical protein
MRRETPTLRDDVEVRQSGGKHRHILPFSESEIHTAFDSLNRALWSLKPIAEKTSDDEYNSAFVYAKRRLSRIFKLAYDLDDSGKQNISHMPAVSEIHSDILWSNDIPARTITVEKTENNLFVAYEEGFHATEDSIEMGKQMENDLIARGIRACGQGVKDVHAPYDPSVAETWRYNPSCVKFSIESEDGTVKLGISSDPPKEPLWYRAYKYLPTLSTPYAHTTFEMENQTNVVKYTYNRNQPKHKQI